MTNDEPAPAESPLAPRLNIDEYAADLAGFDMTDAQKRALLETLWDIMRSLVDLGFDVGDADICGQLFGTFNEASGNTPDALE